MLRVGPRAISWAAMIIAVVMLAACGSTSVDVADTVPTASLAEQAGLVDQRGRFREVLCAVFSEHGEDMTRNMSCDQVLRQEGVEAGGTGGPVSLDPASGKYLALIVPGLGWECLAEWLDYDRSGAGHVARSGFETKLVPVDGLSSSETNAEQIFDYISGLDEAYAGREIIFLGYSKGATDALTALTTYPDLAARTAAMVSLSGSIGGSPYANETSQEHANLFTLVPGSDCDVGDAGAVNSLRTEVRQQWLQDNPLPDHISYYSVISYPDKERISRALLPSYYMLSETDPRNDGQLMIYDQMIPGSTLLAYVNADHVAVAVPVVEEHEILAALLLNHNRFPRELLLESILRYIEEVAPE